MNQVHKEQLTAVENALPNRQGLEVEIFGMEGIPDEIVQTHNQRMLQQFYEAQAERRAKSGNLAPGEQPKRKKIKIETPEELKKRLAEWVIRKSDPNYVPARNGTPGQDAQSPATAVANNSPASAVSPFEIEQPRLFQLTLLKVPPPQPFPGQAPGQAPFPIPGQPYPSSDLPAAPFPGAPPGLPQRPVFNAPSINAQQMQQLHAGSTPGIEFGSSNGLPDAIDDLIASVSHEAPKTDAVPVPEKKGAKKEKDKNMRLVYSDNDISPEEKMAQLSRYAFVRG
jgi:hypothetical protein